MQAAAVCFTGPLPINSTKCLVPKRLSPPCRTFFYPKAVADKSTESSTVDYNSLSSVFPAEACDLLGKEACRGVMCPEATIATSPSTGIARVAAEEVERDYFEYNQPKTVFPGEACNDLGGEFCEADYQTGVYGEMPLAK